jgi:uncharacterized oxidoreductase
MPVYSATKAAIHAFSMALRFQLARVRIKVVEAVPPALDTELNADGRVKRGGFKANLGPEPFAKAVLKGLADEVPEIGFGMTEQTIKASRAELDGAFLGMNKRM